MSDSIGHLFPHATGNALAAVQNHQCPCDFILFGGWFCPFTQRIWIALEEMGIPYQYVEINPFKKEPSFLAINPKGLIPAVSYQGKSIYESSIICEFLVDAYPDKTPQLLPKDAYSRAHARIWIDYTNKYIMPAYFRLFQAKTPEVQTASLEEYTKALKVFADQVKGPYFMGEDFGLVDICICVWIVRDYILVRHRGFSRAAVSERFESYANDLEKKESLVRTLSLREHYDDVFARHVRDEFDNEILRAAKAGRQLP